MRPEGFRQSVGVFWGDRTRTTIRVTVLNRSGSCCHEKKLSIAVDPQKNRLVLLLRSCPFLRDLRGLADILIVDGSNDISGFKAVFRRQAVRLSLLNEHA